ncbi:MAG TPA: hypothetical protein VFC19_31040 [Candidatus Limnocylindrales bacterium]|nr:hypothetical protein [Candidatus Limnocylindrales bacterium]
MLDRLLTDSRRRLATIVAGMFLALGAVAAVNSPAQASDPGDCYTTYSWHTEVAGSHITGHNWDICYLWEPDVPLYVEVLRYESPNVWTVVASGYGTATYNCTGSLFNRYKTTGTAPFDILCS